jgi:nucleotide-binding universal stress UspA family protein
VRSGPVIIGYDGSPASECALQEAGPVLAPDRALVVVVWEASIPFDLIAVPSLLPAPIDIRTALDLDEKLYEAARRMAEHGAALARKAGFKAEGLAVADDVTAAATLIRLAEERDAPVVVLGAHGHKPVTQALLGGTTQDVMRRAPCPVLVRGPADKHQR